MPPISNVFNRDCMEAMREFPDKFFELAIVDPPYGIGADKPTKKPEFVKQRNGSLIKVKSASHKHKDWDGEIPREHYFEELFRVSKNQIIWGGNYFGLSGGCIVWDKLNGESDQFGSEIAYQSFDDRVDSVYFMWSGMIQGVYCGKDVKKALVQQGNKALNERRIHPTQKPIALYKWLLTNYAKPGDKIVDTHLGSGSSRISAYDMGFDFWGYEIDGDYFGDHEKRFQTHISKPVLFAPEQMYNFEQKRLFENAI